ncbi:hypothetical protein CDG77_18920 [Nostoc sp. 'Peltigera membranacea cyanobiont' 213]|uniref:DUF4347 domain-containing protein n=1 Tax=Nostoc sp. 'Peltigera membranacea cyanobiont' 213 TaxID=2014530 RepID=UPI000B95070F|nr:DUF4347 domain-containing protein [Nostoc sp. 'Peltigera membranacea cyanobiont' 213]OYD89443.1 hypothetical protein CDG77_18920 [Nostoc sp. 'Peltigera membranacea cyanobiont' 213]
MILSTLQCYTQELQTWSSHLCVSPSLLLSGCNVAAGDAGEEFIQKLHKLTTASIAASGNLTGNAGSYTENAPEILIAESDTTVTDPDSANFHTGKLTLCIYTNW